MCVPTSVITGVLSATNAIATNVVQYNTQKKENAYRTQIAMNNATLANNEALRQKQMGIDKAREQKAQGLARMRALQAKNASSGFDISSESNLYAYEDIINSSQSEAKTTQEEYDSAAQSYFNKANDYLSQANSYQNKTRDNLFSAAMSLKNDFSQVADEWKNNYEAQKSQTPF